MNNEQRITGYRHQLEMLETKEKELIRQIDDLKRKIQKERENSCSTHSFVYVGHGHNDDCYECTKCGATEWR